MSEKTTQHQPKSLRTIGVVTTSRADYGIYRSLLTHLRDAPDFELQIFAGGMHPHPQFGETWKIIEADGFEITALIKTSMDKDSGVGVAASMGETLTAYAKAFETHQPDMIIVAGDRFEMFAAGTAAVPLNIPLAHIHGGEVTEGAIDNVFRHSLTQMSHLHFACDQTCANRIVQMGQQPDRVFNTGAPAIDTLMAVPEMSPDALTKKLDFDTSQPFLLCTYHPVTLLHENTETQIEALMKALDQANFPVIFSAPNADMGGQTILKAVEDYTAAHDNALFVHNLSNEVYVNLMRMAAAMVGNSSSGILEAVSFQLPVVNIGDRQKGRMRTPNIVDCGYEAADILPAIQKATSPDFVAAHRDLKSPYGDGTAARQILKILKSTQITPDFLFKKFYELKDLTAAV